jgi:hypothetical protein
MRYDFAFSANSQYRLQVSPWSVSNTSMCLSWLSSSFPICSASLLRCPIYSKSWRLSQYPFSLFIRLLFPKEL